MSAKSIIVYKITNSSDDLIYVGYTKNDLNSIYTYIKFIGSNLNTTLNVHINLIGYKNFDVQLLEKKICTSNSEIQNLKQKWMDLLKPELNTYRSSESIVIRNSKCNSKHKIDRINNNKEICDRDKLYYNNKIKTDIITCKCGSVILNISSKRHCKSDKHILWMKLNNE